MLRTMLLLLSGAALAASQRAPVIGAARQSDRMAIDRAITSLNDPVEQTNVFAHTGDGPARYEDLRASTPATGFKIAGPMRSAGAPAVAISHEPWGEAEISLPRPSLSIIFINEDVALAEGACAYEDDGATTRRKPLLFVMKREAEGWKIASLRIVAAQRYF